MGVINREERLQIMLNPAELKLIDNWRFLKRMPSRASAVRELLKRRLAAEGFDVADDGSKDFRSELGCVAWRTEPRPSNAAINEARRARPWPFADRWCWILP